MNITFSEEEYVVPFFGRMHINITGSEFQNATYDKTGVIISKVQRDFLEQTDCHLTVFSMPLISLIRLTVVDKEFENLSMALLTHFGFLRTNEPVYFGVLAPKQADAIYFFRTTVDGRTALEARVLTKDDPEDTDPKAPENRGIITLPYNSLEPVLSIGLQYCTSRERLRFHPSFMAQTTGSNKMKNHIRKVLNGLKKITPEVRDDALEEYEKSVEDFAVSIEGMEGIELPPIPDEQSVLDRIFNIKPTDGRCLTVTTQSGQSYIVPQLDEEEVKAFFTENVRPEKSRQLGSNEESVDDDDDDDDDDISLYDDEDEDGPYGEEERAFTEKFERSVMDWQSADGHLDALSTLICILDLDEFTNLPEDYSPRQLSDYLTSRGIDAQALVGDFREYVFRALGLKFKPN